MINQHEGHLKGSCWIIAVPVKIYPPHPVCDMKLGRQRKGVNEGRDRELPVLTISRKRELNKTRIGIAYILGNLYISSQSTKALLLLEQLKQNKSFCDITAFSCGSFLSPVRPVHHFFAFSWLLSSNHELLSRLMSTYLPVKFISHTGCGGSSSPKFYPTRDCLYILCFHRIKISLCVSSCTRWVPASPLLDLIRHPRSFPELSGMSYRTRGVYLTN